MPTPKLSTLFIPALLLLAACAPARLAETPLPEETLSARATATVTLTASPSLTPLVGQTLTALSATETVTASPIAPAATLAPSATPYIPRITPTAPSQPTLPPPTASPLPLTALPFSVTFTTNHFQVVPGEQIVLNWTSTGSPASQVQIALFSDSREILEEAQAIQTWRDLPPNGSLQTTIVGARERDRYIFELKVADGGYSETRQVRLLFPCPDELFLNTPVSGWGYCATGPTSHPQVVEQFFEGGRMLWFPSENRIYVLYNGPAGGIYYSALQVFENPWAPGEPESDPSITPPPDRVQPLRGFGAIWRGEATPLIGVPDIVVRDKLSWAQGAETTFTTDDQTEWMTCVMRQECPGHPTSRYSRLANGTIVVLHTNMNPPYWFYLNR